MNRLCKFIMCILCLSVLCPITIFASPLKAEDGKDNDYIVLQLLEIMVGDESGDLRLNDNVTRAEFIKVADTISTYRKAIPTTQKTSPFSDVSYKHWAAPYIRAGVDNGVVSGYPDSTFRPDNNVTYEEALTILLKILGYTDTDLGNNYPEGQIALASNIDLSKDIDAKVGEMLTRKQVADLLINVLDTPFKNSSATPLDDFKVKKYNDVVLLATNAEDASVDKDKILTTEGAFKYDVDIVQYLGKTGDILVKDNETIIYFLLDEEKLNTEDFVIYTTISDGVVVYTDGEFVEKKFKDEIKTFYENKQTTFAAIKGNLAMGDTISLVKNDKDEIEYIQIHEGEVEGPFMYIEGVDVSSEISDYLVLKSGKVATIADLENYDVYYYSKELQIVMVYNDKVVGVYNSAIPNQESPITVEVSGINYEIEGVDAFKALSSTGTFKYGDKVTLLLGADKRIAFVLGVDDYESKNVGYLVDSGIKTYTDDKNKQNTEYYVVVVTPDGKETEYKAKRNYEYCKNSIVSWDFEDELVVITRVTDKDLKNVPKINGVVNMETRTVGTFNFASKVEILDVADTPSWKTAHYITVDLQRLEGVKLSPETVLYFETNTKNAITKMILNNVTNDYYVFGTVLSAQKEPEMNYAVYKYNIDGTKQTLQTQNVVYGASAGPARFGIENGQITSIVNLTKLNSKVSELTREYVLVGQNHYFIDENVKIFYKNVSYDYMMITLDDLIENQAEYKIDGVYYDKAMASGGRVRVIYVSDAPKSKN